MVGTMKKSVIQAFSSAPLLDGLENNNVILVTALGLISGKMLTEENLDNPGKIYDSILRAASKSFGDDEVSGNDGYLALTEATIKTVNGRNIDLGNVVIFYDQSIGVSLGNISD